MGVLLGSVIAFGLGLGGFLILVGFVGLGSMATRLGRKHKSRMGLEDEMGGKRSWQNALANLSIPASGAIAYWGFGVEKLALFSVAAISTATFDTVGSEIGKAFLGKTLVAGKMKVAEAGAQGGISLMGTACGALSSLMVCMIAYGFSLIEGREIYVVIVASFLGMLVESLLKSGVALRSRHLANVINTAVGGGLAVLMIRG